jgi:hypothetical protein
VADARRYHDSAGNLTLHIGGNLRENIGRQLGGVPYARDRAKEFSARAIPRDELLAHVESLGLTIPAVIEQLTHQQLEEEYPEVVLEKPMRTQQFLIHLYGHLNWHVGQIDSIRRIGTGDSAIKTCWSLSTACLHLYLERQFETGSLLAQGRPARSGSGDGA